MKLIQKYFPDLTDLQIKQFEQLKGLYKDWNLKINVVSRKDIDELYLRHVLHSLGISKVMPFQSGSKILDVGSGIGKFCFVGALTTDGEYTGVEQRENLVKISNKIIDQNKISKVKFIYNNFKHINFNNYTGFYLYNPFWENIANDKLIDNKITVSESLYKEYNKLLSDKLSKLKQGVLVATYLMKEDDIPQCFSIKKYAFDRKLILWQKT